jgi:TPR repeat protein/CHAT domain-containing protein
MIFKKWFIVFALCLVTFVVSADNQEEVESPSSQAASFQAIVEKAERGDAEAQYNLGMMYYFGEGVTQNDIEAAKWFRKAAQQGHADAQFSLGGMYYLGEGVTQNDVEAAKWFRKAAEQGHADAYGSLGWLLTTQGKFDEAQSLTEKAHQMNPQIFAWTINLGHIYLLKGDRQTARRYYQEALPLIPDEASFEQGPIADFELFIEKGWQVKACRSELEWIRSAFKQFKLVRYYDEQAMEYVKQGQFEQALPLAEKSLKIRTEIIGEKHPDTLTNIIYLAEIYNKKGRYNEALSLLEKCYRLSSEVLGEKHPNTLNIMNNLALVYIGLGRLTEALPLSEKGYRLLKDVLGEKHPDTLTNLNNLASIYQYLGRLSEALPLSESGFSLSKEVLGEKHPKTLLSLNNLAMIHKDLGNLNEALLLLEKGYRLSKEVLGEKHYDTVMSLNNLALIHLELGHLTEALPLSEKAYRLSKEVLGEKHPNTVMSLNNLAMIYRYLGRLTEGLPLSEKAYRLSSEVLGEKHYNTLLSLNNLALIHRDLGHLTEALPLSEKGYRLYKEVLGEKHLNTLMSFNNLAMIYRDLGRLTEALPLSEKGYRLYKEVLGEKHPNTVRSLNNLASIYIDLGRLTEVLPLSEKGYRLSSEVLGEKHPNTVISLNNLASIYKKLGRLTEALPLFEKGYRLYKEVLGEKHPNTVLSLNNLAGIYRDLGRLTEVLPLSEKGYRLSSEVLGEKHPNTVRSLNNLASIYIDLGRLTEVLPLSEKGYRLSSEVLGEKHPNTVISLNNLANIHRDLGHLTEALPLSEKAYRLFSEVLGEKHPNTVMSLNYLALIHRKLGHLNEALPLSEKAYRLFSEVLGEKHPNTVMSLNDLALIHRKLGHLNEALPLSEKSYRLSKEVLGEKHPSMLIIRINLAQTYLKQGKIDEAIEHYEKFVKGVETLRSGDLSAENRQALFKKWVPGYFMLSYLYAFRSRPQDAFRLAEMSKARTLLESLAAKLAAQQSGLTTAEQQQLQKYDTDLAQSTNRIAKALEDNRLYDRIRLETEKNQLIIQLTQFERELRAKYPKYAQVSKVEIIGAKEGAKYLPADAVLISYLVNENDVLAFTLQSDGVLTAHYLGEIPNLKKDLETYRRLLSLGIQEQEQSAPSSHENRPFPLKKRPTIQSLSRQLGKQLLEPLSDIIKDKPHWIISPSGALALIPFETLRLEGENQPVIAQHQISYVQSLSVLKLLQKRNMVYNNLENRKTLLAMGAPLYGNTGTAPNKGHPSTVDFKIADHMVRRGGDYARAFRQLGRGGNYWKNLPGAERELKQLEELFKETKPRIYKQADATEAKLQELNQQGILAQYRYLVFSAHGYLSPQVPALSSIVLGQVNNPPEIDGYVTAGEWAGYDLKSDLMVLSACETGAGEVVGGEGVMGLPYAFYVAGNKNTILTLWSISDEVTVEFITSFFTKLKAGVEQIEALTATKREFLKKGGIYSNPKYWAAFVLYGVDPIQETQPMPWEPMSLADRFDFESCQMSPSVQTAKQRKLSNTGVTLHDYEVVDDGLILLKKVLKTKSIQEIKEAAEGGDAEAQYLLAAAYFKGEGIAQDKARSRKWYRCSALKGFSRAQLIFAERLYYGVDGLSRNRAEAIKWYRTAAENGNATALVRLGYLYQEGEGVSKDLDQALRYYKLAQKLGYLEALTQFGYLYLAKASAAKKRGDSAEYKRTSKQALEYFLQGAEQGLAGSQKALGDRYYYDSYVEKNLETALKWYRKAAKGGNIVAIEKVARMLEKGEGVDAPDPKQAAAYWRQGVELDSDTFRLELASRIIKGSVSPRSPNEAITLYKQAIANGSARAAKELAYVYHEGNGESKRAEQYALKTLELAEKSSPESEDKYPMYAVGAAHLLLKIYEIGIVRPSSKEIVKELRKKFGPAQEFKRFTIPMNCGGISSPIYVYVWDWEREEPPTDMQFEWLSKARGCEASQKTIDAFRKLYKIARDNNVSYKLAVDALVDKNK